MELNKKEEKILIEIFNQCHKTKKSINTKRFRANFSDEIEIIDNLIKKRLIEWDSGKDTYRITFGAIFLVEYKEINNVYHSIIKIFNTLKEIYKDTLDKPVNLNELSKSINLNKDQLIEGILYLHDMISFGRSYSLNPDEETVTPTDAFLRFKDFESVVDQQRDKWLILKDEQEEPMKLRPNQLAKQLCQAIAKTLWDIDPDMTIVDMYNHKAIQQYGGGAPYSKEKTIRPWLSEVDPRDKKSKIGRRKKGKNKKGSVTNDNQL